MENLEQHSEPIEAVEGLPVVERVHPEMTKYTREAAEHKRRESISWARFHIQKAIERSTT